MRILVESAALYSAFAAAFLVSYAVDSGLDQVFLALAQAAQVCLLAAVCDAS